MGQMAYEALKPEHNNMVFVDGDAFRAIMGNDTGHSLEERRLNADRICRLCKFLDDQGIHVICSILSIFTESQQWNRAEYSDYLEVFIDVSLATLKDRDSKGLYAKADRGDLTNVVGVDLDFPRPDAHLVIENDRSEDLDKNAARIIEAIRERIN